MNEEKVIIKPITLIKEEFIENLVKLCNNSGLPFFFIESVLQDLIREIHVASIRQYESDKMRYEQELKKLHENSEEERAE